MGQYTDAITSFEVIMGEKPDFKTGNTFRRWQLISLYCYPLSGPLPYIPTALNLILCYFATNDRDKMKKTFRQMLDISSGAEDEDRYYPAVVSWLDLYTLAHTP